MHRTALALLALAPVVSLGCAQLLSYDDYAARGSEAGVGPAGDTGPVTDTAPDVEPDADAGPSPARPPTRPTGEPKPSGTGTTKWFAAKRFFLGGQDPAGVDADDAWIHWGYDVDSNCTSLEDSIANTSTCKRHPEAKPDVLVDGLRCRDNNFGHHMIAVVRVYAKDFETRANEGILAGSNTWILRIDDLDPGADDPYAPAMLYRSTAEPTGAVPKWDGSDVRSIVSNSVLDHDLDKAITQFPSGYVKDGVWVSGEPSARPLVLPASDEVALALNLEGTVLTVALDETEKDGSAGVVAGVLPVSELETFVKPVAEGAGFCPGSPLYSALLQTFSRFPDVVVGAPGLQDPTKDCDGISLGLGFEVVPIQPVTNIVEPEPSPPSKCGDAGT